MFLKINKLPNNDLSNELYIKTSEILAIKVSYWGGYRVTIVMPNDVYIWKQWEQSKDPNEEHKRQQEAEKEAERLVNFISQGLILFSDDMEV